MLTQPCAQGKRIDYVWELHDESTWINWKPDLQRFIERNPKSKLFMQREYFEGAIKFPLSEIQDSVPLWMKRYFTSSIAYSLAYAIYLGYEELILHGIALAVDEEEYSLQRTCAEAWIAYAMGKGVKISIAQPSSLFDSFYLYGYEGSKDIIIKLMNQRDALTNSLNIYKEELEKTKSNLLEQQGAISLVKKQIEMFKRGKF